MAGLDMVLVVVLVWQRRAAQFTLVQCQAQMNVQQMGPVKK